MAYVNGGFTPADPVNATSVSSPSITLAAGNVVVVGVAWVDGGGSNTASVTDSLGNSYTPGTRLRNSGTTASQMFFARVTTGGNATITATFAAGAQYRSMNVAQYDGMIASGSPLDAEAPPATGSGTSPTGSALTTTSANAIAVAFLAAQPASAAGGGFNLRSAGEYSSLSDRSLTAAGSVTPTFTTADGQWNVHSMAFKTTGPAPSPTVIDRNNAAIFYSPSTWDDSGTARVAISAGSYLKFDFTGTSLGMTIEALSGLSVYPTFRAYIDDRPAVDITPTSGQTSIAFASGLAAGTHRAYLLLKGIPLDGRWDRTAAMRVTGFMLDNGAGVSAPSGHLAIRGKSMLCFGDSITEGERTLSTDAPPMGADAMLANVPLIAEALGAEFGQIGHGAQGFEQAGVGGVPTFNSAWGLYSSGRSRLTAGRFSPAPDYITSFHGFNGAVSQAAVATAISNLRGAAPTSWIFMMVPAGGQARAAIAAAVSAATSAGDLKVRLIDCGPTYQQGMTSTTLGPANEQTTDLVHPKLRTNARIAAEQVRQIQRAIEPRRFTVIPA